MVNGSSSGEEKGTQKPSQAAILAYRKHLKQNIYSKKKPKNSLLYSRQTGLKRGNKNLTINQGEQEDGLFLSSVNGYKERWMNHSFRGKN